MRWFFYLILSFLMEIVVLLLTPVLPLFAKDSYGFSNNGTEAAVEPRLPTWLSWFDTPDNSLLGDSGWKTKHPNGTYLDRVKWLYRNRLYGFKWTVLSMPVQVDQQEIDGNIDIGYQNQRYGSFVIYQPNGAWQYKTVFPVFGKIFEGNFGWLLDNKENSMALFMFSPRIKEVDHAR